MAGPSDSLELAAGCNIESVLTELASDQNELVAELARRDLDGIQQGLRDAREVSQSLRRLQKTLIASQS
jgi:hypothetical protein